MKITAQNNIILSIIDNLENSILGKGILQKITYEMVSYGYSSTLTITVKDGFELSPEDIFWLGYQVGGDN